MSSSLQPEPTNNLRTFQPRQYQQELFHEARSKNVVVYLDTGNGKTLISVLLIKEKAHQLNQSPKRNTVFLAPRVSLVHQQADVLVNHLDLRIGRYYGEMNVDCWNKAQWLTEWQEHDVMVMTPQILLDVLRHGFVTMHDINLLIFDEAHHCVKKTPYNCIMSEFYHDARYGGSRPHILGLTASPVNAKNMSSLEATMKTLECNLDAKVLSIADREELDRYAPLPRLHVVKFSKSDPVGLTASAKEKLTEIHWELQQIAGQQERAWDAARLRMLGVLDSGLQFDKEKHNTASSTMSRNMIGIMTILQELGPLAATAAFAEIIKSEQQNQFAVRQRQLQSNGRLQTLDGHVLDTEDDWFQGLHLDQQNNQQASQHSSEWGPVNKLLARAALALADCIAPQQHQASLIGAEAQAQSKNFRQQLAAKLHGILDQVHPDILDDHVAKEKGSNNGVWEPPCKLATRRLQKLVAKLQQYQGLCQSGAGSGMGQQQTSSPQGWCCIIFVQRKMTAIALHAVLRMTPALGFLKSAPFMGFGGSTTATSLNAKAQGNILKQYRAGALNCLVSTSVAEEGLDVRQCQLVVRYDLPSTLLAFIQSRGRARMLASDMVLMVDRHSLDDLGFLKHALEYEQQMKGEAQKRQRQSEGISEPDAEVVPTGQEGDQPELYVAATGAKVSSASAKQRLYYFCDKLPSDQYTQLRPRFSTETTRAGSVTRVILPNNSPIRSATGHAQPNKNLAVTSACLEALRLLYEAGALNDHLQPETADAVQRLEADEESEDRNMSFNEDDSFPDSFGDQARSPAGQASSHEASKSLQLYLHCFQMELANQLPGAASPDLGQPIGILTLQELPSFPAFDMLLPRGFGYTADSPGTASSSGTKSRGDAAKEQRTRARVSCAAKGCRQLRTKKIGILQCWHRALCMPKMMPHEQQAEAKAMPGAEHMRDRSYKTPEEWTASSHHAFYILAPIEKDGDDIDWECVNHAKYGYEPVWCAAEQPLTDQHLMLSKHLTDAVVVTIYNSWPYFHQHVDWDRGLSSTFDSDSLVEVIPDGTTHGKDNLQSNRTHEQALVERAHRQDAAVQANLKRRAARGKIVTYQDYFSKRWQRSGLDPRQPLLAAKTWYHFNSDKWQAPPVHISPELCRFHPLTQGAYVAARYVPHLVWWLFGLLRGQELRQLIKHPSLKQQLLPDAMLMMEALVSKACHELICYETLETLGDAFLKFAVSEHLFRRFPKAHEGQLTLHKIGIISNDNLARVGKRLGLYRYLALPLDTDSWMPPGFPEIRLLQEAKVKHKVLADGIEALMGAYLQAGSLEGARALLAALNILPDPGQAISPLVPGKGTGTMVGSPSILEHEVQSRRCKGPERHLNYTFRDKSLLMEAFTHCSWPDPNPPCYQRLEFLGDAVLDMLITRAIVASYRSLPPGRISQLRSASVNNARLACIAVTHNLHCYLRQCSPHLFGLISDFVVSFRDTIADEQQKRTAVAETSSQQVPSESSIKTKLELEARAAAYNWATSAAFGRGSGGPPKVLGDVLESVAGAAYVDTAFELDSTWQIVLPLMQPLVTPSTVPIHPVAALYERCQHAGLKLQFHTNATNTAGEFCTEAVVNAVVFGRCSSALSKQLGRKSAAEDALQHWDEHITALK
ncbi:hypothetical protein WJX74_006245 [Apatococcus lobatus]|uniref:Dicer-like protein 1 n=1 Tax=Apatococcus lobatus TaxID=904363 RepID=A0AAW1Q5T9_9CHLO